ncbi:MAG: ABC transporter ATP-binding protein [Lachnospiraceae bacterium]|nr:ABC transporter ATP-binding protein [Lachnospiraceae bacterium]MBQ9134620.1 ABC transporter ATP-binding protein [Lachnospiraceae bacterium]
MKQWKIFTKTMGIMGKHCVPYLLGIFFMSTGWAFFSVMSSILLKDVVDAAGNGNADRIPVIIAGNVVGGLISMLIYRAAAITYNVEAKRAYGTLCKKVFHHEVRLPYTYYEENHSGDFMSKLSYDLEKTGSIYGSRLRRTVAPILQVVVFLVPMLILSWQITLCLIVVNLIMLLINGLLIEPIKKVSKELSKSNSTMTEKLSNLLQGMEQARMYGAGKNTVDEFVTENYTYAKKSNKKMMFTAILESCSTGFDLLCALAFLMLGIYFVQQGFTTLGSLTAIYALYGSFSFQFLQLGRYLPELIGCMVNAQNIFDFLEEKEEPANWYREQVKESANWHGDTAIEIDNISFCYREDKPLLQDYSMKVMKGESVAITGASGCGKTTISKLLLGLYPVEKGDIKILGKSYREYANATFREQIAYVPQEPYLFSCSIRENIRMGRPEATDAEVESAAKLAYAHDFIINLEEGYDTNVGERGNNLSGGQRQRIAIARAILKDAPILLLDEATSALDNESENYINMALKSLKNQKTIVMIAHRPSTIALADRECRIS